MKKILHIFFLFILAHSASAQSPVFTFKCICDYVTAADSNCDICSSTIKSRLFCGILVKKNGIAYKWIDAPYIVKEQGNNLVLQEIAASSESISVNLYGTAFGTMDSLKAAVDCPCGLYADPMFYASDSTNIAPIYQGDTLAIVGRNLAQVTFDSINRKWVVNVDSIATSGTGTVTSVDISTPNPGITHSGAPITVAGTITIVPANDLAAIEALASTGIPSRIGAETWALRSLTPGTGITITNGDGVSGNPTITNASPDQTVSIASGAGMSVTGTYPSFTVTNTSPDQTVSITGGTGISATGTYPNFTITNTAPNQVVSITGGGINAVTGTYPNFTITGTEVDGSVTNELQTVANTSDATSHTVTLSSSGGSVKLVEGTNITLATTGTSADGVVTISSTGGTGTVTSVGLSMPSIFTVTNSPVTTSGTLTASFNSQAANLLFASPSGASGTPTFRTMTAADIPANLVTYSKLQQASALSILGNATNTTANLADIVSVSDGQVMRRSGTTLGWGTVATAGIANNAVTYAKMQQASANTVLGNPTGILGNVQELTVANLYTMLGLSGTAGRFAFWSGTNTLSNSANLLWDNTNGRQTITGQTSGSGANGAFLNLNSGALSATTEFLRMSGNVNGNMMGVMSNASNASSAANTIWQILVGGAVAGDPMTQYTVSGVLTTTMGLDNSDGDKFKITPNSSTPGGTANSGIIVTNDATPLVGINKDVPVEEMDVAGEVRARAFINTGNLWSNGLCTFGTGAGTSPSINVLKGGNNFYTLEFTTGTAPVANGTIFTLTFPNAFPAGPTVTVITPRNQQTAADITKFFVQVSSDTQLQIQANGTLSASTQYKLMMITGCYE